MKRIDGKVVWITGASSGIGEALAYEMDKKGCKLILSSRKEDQLQQVKNNCSHPENAKVLPMDLEKFDEIPKKAEEAIAYFGQVDVLINNAGISQRSLIVDTDLAVYKKLMDVDYLGTVAVTKAVLPHFVERKSGHIATVSSLMGMFSSPYRSGYCGAKHALHGFFDALRMEHEKDNIGVTLVCPGFIATDVAKNALKGDGTPQNTDDEATKNGMPVAQLAQKMVRAIEKGKMEAYIGRKEILAIYVKRFFPKLLHRIVMKSEVR